MLSLWIFSQLMLIGIFQAADAIYGPSSSLAKQGEFPYMVEIITLRSGTMKYCGGAIIDPTHILTAAHCVFNSLKEEISIIAGAVDLFSISRIEHPGIARIHVHEEYVFNKTSESNPDFPRHDIAVLTLITALPFGDYIKAVNLPDPHFLPVCQTCEFAGWGSTEIDEPISDNLRSIQMVILSPQECIELLTILHSNEFCAIDPLLETCGLGGDSGSPLVFDNVVYGVYARGLENPIFTSVFTKVSAYLKFIREALKK